MDSIIVFTVESGEKDVEEGNPEDGIAQEDVEAHQLECVSQESWRFFLVVGQSDRKDQKNEEKQNLEAKRYV